MRMDIDIRVNVPSAPSDGGQEFIEGVMAVFRAAFPEAEPLPRTSIDTPSPVTVTIHTEDDDARRA